MRKYKIVAFLAMLIAIISMTGCSFGNEKWEYKVVPVLSEGNSRDGAEAGKFSSVTPSEEQFNKLGQEGWELTSSYLEMETAWMNFGNNNYVTGLQPNVRPQRVVFVFKRKR